MPFTVKPTSLPDVLLFEPKVFADERGYFFESFNQRDFADLTGLDTVFVQDNHSFSIRNALRGLHYQVRHAQGKLVRVVRGEVFDVAVDMRRSSANFGKWIGVTLTAENRRQVWVPPGFAHGFLALSDQVEFLYKTSDYWYPEHDRCIRWNDPDLAIAWPLQGAPIVAAKDAAGGKFRDAEGYPDSAAV